jgi:hypothetical protein
MRATSVVVAFTRSWFAETFFTTSTPAAASSALS